MHWRKKLKNPYLGSWDLEKQDGTFDSVIVTIEGFSEGKVVSQSGSQEKTFVKLKEFPKKMVCNITNFKRLQERFSSNQIEDFTGEVILGVEKVKSPEGMVDALRFSKRAPKVVKKPSIDNERFGKAIDSIKKGEYEKEKFLPRYEFTQEQLDTIEAEL